VKTARGFALTRRGVSLMEIPGFRRATFPVKAVRRLRLRAAIFVGNNPIALVQHVQCALHFQAARIHGFISVTRHRFWNSGFESASINSTGPMGIPHEIKTDKLTLLLRELRESTRIKKPSQSFNHGWNFFFRDACRYDTD
jgi:hypothetical protein